jgi:hypothetical protein
LNNMGYVSHAEAIAHQKIAGFVAYRNWFSWNQKHYPWKIIRIYVSNRPIIAIGPNGSDFAEIITETNTGIFFDYSEKWNLKV